MKIQMEIISRRLEFLHLKLNEVDDFPLQVKYLMNEIDKNLALLLELEVEQKYQEIEEPESVTQIIKELED